VVTWVAGTAAVVLGGGVSSEDEEDEVGLLGGRGDGSGDGSLWGVSSRGGDDGVGMKLSQVDAGVGVVGNPPGTVCGVGGADSCRTDDVAACNAFSVRSRSSETAASSSDAFPEPLGLGSRGVG
jgi:hypothetical protein